MSIEVKVFPTTSAIATWGSIRKSLCDLGGTKRTDFGYATSLIEVSSKKPLRLEQQLSMGHGYYLEFVVKNTLGISVFDKADDLDEANLEFDYLNDYGSNLNAYEGEALAGRWKVARHFYEISSFGGRGNDESSLFIKLAAAIAYASLGYVVVTNNGFFDLGIGVYTPESFERTTPTF
jgi:hypothetical protein